MTQTMTRPQHMVALEKANGIRMERAGIKRELLTAASGRAATDRVIELLLHPPDCLLGMGVADLLGSCRRWGPARARRVLTAAQVNELRKVRDLTARQRDAVVRLLRAMP